MAKKAPGRVKHVPIRTCVGCRQTDTRRIFCRIVRTEEGVRYDPTGKQPGRGAYLHLDAGCWQTGLKGALAAALRTDISDADRKLFEESFTTLEIKHKGILEAPATLAENGVGLHQKARTMKQ